MNSSIDPDNISPLLASTQQLRTHWSRLIITIMSFAIIMNLAVWTYFLQSYVTLYNTTGDWPHSYIAIASTISLVLLILWRWYARHLDSNIAALYPDLIYFEGRLACPSQYGTSGYLMREFGDAGSFLQTNLSPDDKAVVVSRLVKNRCSGGRGQNIINWITLLIMVGLIFIVFGLGIFPFWDFGHGAGEQGIVRLEIKCFCGVFSAVSFIGMIYLIWVRPRKPSDKQVEKIINDIKKNKSATS